MDEEFGGAIPLWAQRLLLQYQVESAELEPRIAELKASTATKLVAFKALKEKKEKEQEQAILDETVRVNAEILKRRDAVTNDSSQFQVEVESRMNRMRELEKELHEKQSMLPKLSEILLKAQSELAGLKKQEELLNANFSKVSATVTEESKKMALSDPAWADLDLLEPVFQAPKIPAALFLARPLEQKAPTLLRPGLATAPRKDASSTSKLPQSQQNSDEPISVTRAARTELVCAIRGERSRAVIESVMARNRIALRSIFEALQREDPQDPLNPDARILASRGIQNLHTFYGKDIELVEWLIQKEVAYASEPKHLFPEGSVQFGILSTFAMRYGNTFLKDSIRDVIFRILKEDKPYELNPQKVGKNEWVDLNIKSVKALAYDVLIEIVGSSFKLPMQMRKVISFMKAEVSRKFPNDGFAMIGRFLFDSLFCKVLERPEDFNIGIKEVPDKMRPLFRVLSIMIYKVSRNEPFTDDIYLPLNEFVSSYVGQTRKFLTESMKVPEREIWATVTPCTLTSCLEDIENGIGKLSIPRLAEMAKRTTELDTQKLYSYSATIRIADRLKVIQDHAINDKLLNLEITNPFVEEIFDVLFGDDECSVIGAIAAIAAPRADFDAQPLANAIITCSMHKDPTGAHAEYLVRSMLRKEMSAYSNSAATPQVIWRLLNGFGAAMYGAFARALGGEYLQEVVPGMLENVRKNKLGKLDKKGAQALAVLIDSFALSFPRVPLPMWKLASFLTRQLIDIGPGLFLVKFIGQALDNPAKYMTKLPEGKDRDRLQKRLAAIRMFLIRVSTTEPLAKVESKYFAEANPVIKEVNTAWIAANDTWSAKEPSNSASHTSFITYSWEDVRPAIKLWLEFTDSDSSFDVLLAKDIDVNLAFTLGELLFSWALPPGRRTLNAAQQPPKEQ